MNCKRCTLTEKREELYINFFDKVFNEVHKFDNDNSEKLFRISGHIKDTLILHGQITAEFGGGDSLFHTHKGTDQ